MGIEGGNEIRRPADIAVVQPGGEKAVAAMLDVRLLFSCLVDADFLDTEAHFEGDAQGKRARLTGPPLDPEAGIDALNRYMGERIRAVAQGKNGELWLLEDGRAGRLLQLQPHAPR